MIARTSRALPMILATITLASATAIVVIGEVAGLTGTWILAVWFAIGGLFFLVVAIRKPAQVLIRDGQISAGRQHFLLRDIECANVVRVWVDGGESRILQIRFFKMPTLTIGSRIVKFFQRFALPRSAKDGAPLAMEPRVLIPLAPTNLSDEELNAELKKALGKQIVADQRPAAG